jgi:hypothetical protein
MRRKKKERRGWREKKRKPALPNAIPGFVTENTHLNICTYNVRKKTSYLIDV